jgi:PAS domain S-box-containing protein
VNFDILQPLRSAASSALSLPAELAIFEKLFDHVPDIAFFMKDDHGRYLAVNQSLVDRCGLREKKELIGRGVSEVFPEGLSQLYASQDETVLRTGRAIVEHLELHWYAHRRPGWCLTTKFPMRNQDGEIIGVVGISRDLRAPGDRETIPSSLAGTLEYLEAHCDEHFSPSSLARRAGLPPVRFARLIKRIFRITPNQLIMQTRIAAAARMLTETNRPVAEIAYDCGFYDHSAMTRAFRSATHLTPTQFRGLKSAEGARAQRTGPQVP